MTKPAGVFSIFYLRTVLVLSVGLAGHSFAQKPQAAKIELGSETAKNGFKNEDEIRNRFNNWNLDANARGWLAAIHYKTAKIEAVADGATASGCANTEVLISKNGREIRRDHQALLHRRRADAGILT